MEILLALLLSLVLGDNGTWDGVPQTNGGDVEAMDGGSGSPPPPPDPPNP